MVKVESKSVLVQEVVLCLSRDEAEGLEEWLRGKKSQKSPLISDLADQLSDAVRRLDLDADSY